MYSSGIIKFCVIFSFILISLCNAAPVQSFEIIMCSDADTSAYEPVNVKENFSNGDKVVTAFVKLDGVPGGKKIRFQWIDPEGNLYREAMGNLPSLPQGVVYTSFKTWNSIILRTARASWFPGEWKVKIFLGEEEVASTVFSVEKTEELPCEFPPPYKLISPVYTQSDMMGKILDADTDKPLEGAKIELGNISATSNERGCYYLPAVPPGEYELKVTCPSYYDTLYNCNIKGNNSLCLDIPCKKQGTAIHPVSVETEIPDIVYSSVYHLYPLLNKSLITYIITNNTGDGKKVIVSSKIMDYSPVFTDTVYVPAKTTYIVKQTPPFLPGKVNRINEATTAVVNGKAMCIEEKEEIFLTEESKNITLLAKDTLVYIEKNPVTGAPDFLHYTLGAWLTTHIPEIDELLRTVAENHPEKKLIGYQAGELGELEELAKVPREQAKAIYTTLQSNLNIIYTNSSTQYGTDEMTTKAQRLRLPEDIMETGTANCLEGTILFATLLEAAHLNPVIVIASAGHAFVGWEKWDQAGEYDFLTTTYIGKGLTFEEALADGNADYEETMGLIINGRAVFLDINYLRQENINPVK